MDQGNPAPVQQGRDQMQLGAGACNLRYFCKQAAAQLPERHTHLPLAQSSAMSALIPLAPA